MKYFQPEDMDELMEFFPQWIELLANGELTEALDEVDPGEFTAESLLAAIEKCTGSRRVTSPLEAPAAPPGMRESLEGEDEEFIGIAHPDLPYGLAISKGDEDSNGYATLHFPVDGEWSDAIIEFDVQDADEGWYFVISKVEA